MSSLVTAMCAVRAGVLTYVYTCGEIDPCQSCRGSHHRLVLGGPRSGWSCMLVMQAPLGVNLLKFSTHSPTALGPLIAHGRWKSQHAEQGSIYLEFQTCTSAHPFDTHL